VERQGDEFVIEVPELERITFGPGASPGEVRRQMMYQIERLGVNKALEKAGVKPGDTIRCREITWEWSSKRRGK
jgi:Obg family GTPase CgtA-like protein